MVYKEYKAWVVYSSDEHPEPVTSSIYPINAYNEQEATEIAKEHFKSKGIEKYKHLSIKKLKSMEEEYDESPEGIKEYRELMRSVLEFNLNYERKWWQKWKQIKPTEKELDEFIKALDEENSWLFDW